MESTLFPAACIRQSGDRQAMAVIGHRRTNAIWRQMPHNGMS